MISADQMLVLIQILHTAEVLCCYADCITLSCDSYSVQSKDRILLVVIIQCCNSQNTEMDQLSTDERHDQTTLALNPNQVNTVQNKNIKIIIGNIVITKNKTD